MASRSTDSLLKLENVDAGYDFLQILRGVSLRMNEGEFVAIIGPNGVGKTTSLRVISGLLKPKRGEVFFRNEPLSHLLPHEISRLGISYVSEDLNLFVNMPIYENLIMGAYLTRDERKIRQNMENVYELFPRLAERRKQLAGTLSGGERKMLGIARAMMSNPQLMLVDEPSLGLAPYLARNVFDALKTLNTNGLSILLVEQNVHTTLEIASRGYVMEQGKIVLEGNCTDLARDEHIQRVYLGI